MQEPEKPRTGASIGALRAGTALASTPRLLEERAMAGRSRTVAEGAPRGGRAPLASASASGAEPMSFSATMRTTSVRIAKKVAFFLLPRPVQDRFVAATLRTAPPTPILFQRAPRTRVWGYLGGSGLMTLVAILLLRAGWGDV